MRNATLPLLLLFAAACTVPEPPPDAAADLTSAPNDLTARADLTAPPDLGGTSDLTTPQDLAVPADLTVLADLTVPADLTVLDDLTFPDDLTIPADLTAPADLTTPADLPTPPDLTLPPGPRGPVRFFAGLQSIAGDSSFRLTTGDFNGDLSDDVAFVSGSGILLALVQSTGTLGTPSPVMIGGGTARAVVSADLNKDGKVDLLAALVSPNGAVAVLLGNGDGTFAAPVQYNLPPAPTAPAGAIPEGITTGDVNADGNPDVVTADGAGAIATALLGNGDGTLRTGTNLYNGGQTGTEPVIADLNGDGNRDVAVVYHAQMLANGRLSMFFGNGDGTFQAVVTGPVPGDGSYDIDAADFNGDNLMDLAITNAGLSQGGGTSYTNSNIAVLLGTGGGNFAAPVTYAVGQSPRSMRVADLNGDGRRDIAASVLGDNTGPGQVAILFGNADGTFQTAVAHHATSHPNGFGIGDIDYDGLPDLIATAIPTQAGANAGSLSVLYNIGGGSFRGAPFTTSGAGAGTTTLVGDVDRDGQKDVILVSQSRSVAYYHRNLGSGQLAPRANISTGAGPSDALLLDVSGDTFLDLITADTTANTVSVLLGNGRGNFSPQPVLNTQLAPYALATGDLNRDGQPDFVVTERSANQFAVYLNQGGGSFNRGNSYPAGTSPGGIAVLDLNGNNQPDVAVLTMSQGINLFLNDGQGNFTRGANLAAGTGLRPLRAADVDGDGQSDLVTYAPPSSGALGTVLLYYGNGQGGLTAAGTTFPAGQFPSGLQLGDVNGDTIPDVVVAGATAGSLTVLYGLGSSAGFSTTPQIWSVGAGVVSPAIGDLDGDGRADLVVGAPTFGQVSFVRNLGP